MDDQNVQYGPPAPQDPPQSVPVQPIQPSANVPQQLPQQPQQPTPQEADTQHHSILGRAFKSLLGNQTNYQIDPSTGKLTSTTTEQEPGAIWKHMLAGVILGGATASKNKTTGFTQGFTEGAGSQIEQAQKQDLVKRAQAKEQFEDQLKAQQNQRANQTADTEDKLKLAQIAMHNAQTLRENHLAQREDLEFHDKTAASGRTQIQPFVTAGLPYTFKDVSESEMNNLLKNNPNAIHQLWEPTGTRIVVGQDGKVDHELTYSAVDPSGNVKITNDQIKNWKDAGIDQVYGNQTWDALTHGKEIPASQYMAINQKAQELTNQKTTAEKQKFDVDKEKSTLALNKAQVDHLKAETSKLYEDAQDKKDASKAMSAFTSGGDLTKLSGKQQDMLVKTFDSVIKNDLDVLKSLRDPTTGQVTDQEKAKELYNHVDVAGKARDRILGIQSQQPASKPTTETKQDVVHVKVGSEIGTIPANKLDKFLEDNPDAETGQVVTDKVFKNKMSDLVSNKTVRFDGLTPPDPKKLWNNQELFTDGKGNYIIREQGTFNNPQWKSLGSGEAGVLPAQ